MTRVLRVNHVSSFSVLAASTVAVEEEKPGAPSVGAARSDRGVVARLFFEEEVVHRLPEATWSGGSWRGHIVVAHAAFRRLVEKTLDGVVLVGHDPPRFAPSPARNLLHGSTCEHTASRCVGRGARGSRRADPDVVSHTRGSVRGEQGVTWHTTLNYP